MSAATLTILLALTCHVKSLEVNGDSLNKLVNKIEALESMVYRLTDENQRILESVKNYGGKDLSYDKHVRRARASETPVGFFARVSATSEDHLASNQNIIFEDVLTNIGNGYNSATGEFVCPVEGLYVFTTHILTQQSRELWFDLDVNGVAVARGDARGTDGRHNTASQTVLVELKMGDVVSVKNARQGDGALWGDLFSTFAGYILL